MKQHDIFIPFCDKCALETNSIFKHLTRDEAEKLTYEKDFRHYKRGDILYHEGNRISGFYCVNSGIIKVFKTGLDGKEQIIRFAKPGDIIAYRSVLSNEPACTTAKVIEDCQVCFIPTEILISFVKSNPSFALELVKLTCHELGEANSYITDIAQKTVRERLAEVLIQLVTEFGLDEQKYLKISLTREELAGLVGTATETAIRLLNSLREEGLLATEGKKVRLLDRTALAHCSENA